MGTIIVEEVAPFVGRVVLRKILMQFTTLAGWGVCFGLIVAADALVKSFFGQIDSAFAIIPWLGRFARGPVLTIEHKLSNYLGGLESHLEQNMADSWHQVAMLFTWVANYVDESAEINLAQAQRLASLWDNNTLSHRMRQDFGAAKHAEATGRAAHVAASHAQHEAHAALSSTAGATVIPSPRIGTNTRTYPAGRIGSKVSGLEGEVDHLLDWTIPGLRDRVGSIDEEVAKLWRRVRANTTALGVGALTGALAFALAKLGGGWIRCDRAGKVGRRLCGMDPRLLDGLLLGTVALYSGFSIVQLAEDLLAVEDQIIAGIKLGVKELHGF